MVNKLLEPFPEQPPAETLLKTLASTSSYLVVSLEFPRNCSNRIQLNDELSTDPVKSSGSYLTLVK